MPRRSPREQPAPAPDEDGAGAEAGELLAEIMSRPLDEVVAARDEAVRRLRSEKRRELAAEIATLRRPSPSLWAVNRLRDVDPGALESLMAAGQAVRDAQGALLAADPGGPARLAQAASRFAVAVQAGTAAAMRLLAAEGHGSGADAERRIQSMLRAAAVGDPSARHALATGRLVSEPQPAGFDSLAASVVAPQPRDGSDDAAAARAVPVAAVAEGTHAAAAERERRLELERAASQRRVAAEEAERLAAERRAAVAALKREVVKLERQLARIHEQIAAAQDAAEAADAVATEARAALDRALVAIGSPRSSPPAPRRPSRR
jgi:hypothetical protein